MTGPSAAGKEPCGRERPAPEEKQDNKRLYECVAYFKGRPGFQRLFERIRGKYASLGRLGGKVVINAPTEDEREAISGLLKKSCGKEERLYVNIEELVQSLKSTRFDDVDFLDVLNNYFMGDLTYKKTVREDIEAQRSRFFLGLKKEAAGTPGEKWLEHILEGRASFYNAFVKRYDKDREELSKDIRMVCRALASLPVMNGISLPLPVFSARITKNPHALDEQTSAGSYFVGALSFLFEEEKPVYARDRAELYYAAGLLVDDVSNYVLSRGLYAYEKNGLSHEGWRGFAQRGEPLMATLNNLSRLDRLISPSQKLFIVENPAVFTRLGEKSGQPLACTYGQVKIAALVFLDKLAREGTEFWYSGDFDPEGLLIADRLKLRYGKLLHLWGYSRSLYEKSLSQVPLGSERLKKLDRLQCPELVELAAVMKEKAFAGYQEQLLPSLEQELLSPGGEDEGL